jgi:hypothetical protein
MPAAEPLKLELYLSQSTAYDADGYLVAQPDTPGQKGSGSHEVMLPLGLMARQLDPVVDKDGNISSGTPMLAVWEGGQALLMPMSDSRTVPGLPSLKKGETGLHGHASNFFRNHEDGSCSISTTEDGTATGRSVFYKQGPAGYEWAAPWGRQRLDATGWHLQTRSGGCSIDMGGIGGMPAPLNSLGGYFRLQAPSVIVKTTLMAVGPVGAPADSVAKATPTLAAIAALNTVLAAMQTPGAFISPPSGGPCTAGPGLLAVLTTAIATLSAAPAAVPSNSFATY